MDAAKARPRRQLTVGTREVYLKLAGFPIWTRWALDRANFLTLPPGLRHPGGDTTIAEETTLTRPSGPLRSSRAQHPTRGGESTTWVEPDLQGCIGIRRRFIRETAIEVALLWR